MAQGEYLALCLEQNTGYASPLEHPGLTGSSGSLSGQLARLVAHLAWRGLARASRSAGQVSGLTVHQALEKIFRLREERDLEIDPGMKAELHRAFQARLDEFIREHNLKMTRADFLAATRDDYRNWRRNPH